MPKLVVIAPDLSLSRAVAELAGDTLHVLGAASARSGISACCALEPACIVIEHDPPTIDGVTVARSLRRQPTAVVSTPIVLLVPATATTLRTDALAEGVDVCLMNPVRPADVLGQCHALIAMARRLASSGAARRHAKGAERSAASGSEAPPSTDRRPRALTGSLQRMPPTTVLAVLELEQRSGDLVLTGVPGSKKRLVLQLAAGLVVGGRLGSVSLDPVETMREALRWSGRRFEFAASDPKVAPANASRLGPLLMEAMRSEPEGDLAELNSPPSSLAANGPHAQPPATSQLATPGRGSGVSLRPLPPRRRSQPPPRRSVLVAQPEEEDVLEAENWASDAAASSTGEAP